MAKILTPAIYETIEKADTIEAWLLTANDYENDRPKVDRAGPVKLAPALAKKFSAALLSFDSYNSWDAQKGCVTDDGARLRITRGGQEVHVRFCFECDILTIGRGSEMREINFDNGHTVFADLLLQVFPNDAVVRRIPRRKL